MKKELINYLYNEVEKLSERFTLQEEKIKKLENLIKNKDEQINYLKEELRDLINKVEQFNSLFNELPIYNGIIEDEENNRKIDFNTINEKDLE
ncbi:MAG TPA: hypothetical protein PLF21_06310 [Exilispira sp.]|nr:hypothetical protein [Exilispira sp.]